MGRVLVLSPRQSTLGELYGAKDAESLGTMSELAEIAHEVLRERANLSQAIEDLIQSIWVDWADEETMEQERNLYRREGFQLLAPDPERKISLVLNVTPLQGGNGRETQLVAHLTTEREWHPRRDLVLLKHSG